MRASLSILFLSAAVLPLSAQAQTANKPVADPLTDFSDVEAQINSDGDGDTASGEDAAPAVEPMPPEDAEAGMADALETIEMIVLRADPEAQRLGNTWRLTIDDVMLDVITDTAAGRMRIVTPIAEVDRLPEGALMRLMQANFDSALDARYAIANELVWGTFIHPLASLTRRDFASGLLQTKTLADTFGTTFSSGALVFGGGDSEALNADLLDQLLQEELPEA